MFGLARTVHLERDEPSSMYKDNSTADIATAWRVKAALKTLEHFDC